MGMREQLIAYHSINPDLGGFGEPVEVDDDDDPEWQPTPKKTVKPARKRKTATTTKKTSSKKPAGKRQKKDKTDYFDLEEEEEDDEETGLLVDVAGKQEGAGRAASEEAIKRRIISQLCKVHIGSGPARTDCIRIRLCDIEELGEEGGQRRKDPAMADLICSLILKNAATDVLNLGVWEKDMFITNEQSEQALNDMENLPKMVYGGQHYYYGWQQAAKLNPEIAQTLRHKVARVYAFGLLTIWWECELLARFYDDEEKTQFALLNPEDVGRKLGVEREWRKRYDTKSPMDSWREYRGKMWPALRALTPRQRKQMPTVMEARTILIDEHNKVMFRCLFFISDYHMYLICTCL